MHNIHGYVGIPEINEGSYMEGYENLNYTDGLSCGYLKMMTTKKKKMMMTKKRMRSHKRSEMVWIKRKGEDKTDEGSWKEDEKEERRIKK